MSRCLPPDVTKGSAKDEAASSSAVETPAIVTASQPGVTGVLDHPSDEAARRNPADEDEAMDAVQDKHLGKSPGQTNESGKYSPAELEWKDVGSGTFARTFVKATRMRTTTKGGPPMQDIHKRIIRSAETGVVLDECIVEDVPDQVLHRFLLAPEDIRVELIMKGAEAMFTRKGADVCELFSQPRVTQEAVVRSYDGVKLTPGWSLDLTREDPVTGQPWDMTKRHVREMTNELVRTTEPSLVIGSPPCTMFSSLQGLSKKKRNKE